MNMATNPYTGNRYAFGGGNPLSNIELDGHDWLGDAWNNATSWVSDNRAQIAGFAAGLGAGLAFGAGAAALGVATDGVGFAAAVECGAVAGAVSSVVEHAVSGTGDQSLSGYLNVANTGGLYGAAGALGSELISTLAPKVASAFGAATSSGASDVAATGTADAASSSTADTAASGEADTGGGAADGGTKVTPCDGGTHDANGNFISGSAEGQRHADQLRLESANSPFAADGTLTPNAISASSEVIPGENLGNKALQERFAQSGGTAQWGKYSTPTYQSPYGPYQVHYYYNSTSREGMYNFDYKVVMNRR